MSSTTTTTTTNTTTHTPIFFDLLVLAADFQPTHFATHLPILVQQQNQLPNHNKIPILLLPGSTTSTELGKLLGVKCVGVIGFQSPPVVSHNHHNESTTTTHIHNVITSFVQFIKSRMELT
jgi:hypothetical protein